MSGKSTAERTKVKKKMSKAQMQLALIKKKQCDATALIIVERLLEPVVDSQWLLENLKHINKSHMEDVIEERAIVKLCGYVLCKNPITVVYKQQYHISTKSNKVYDISRRKNFCSSTCYGASNYLLEQMLTSPLWMREKEEIPVFKLLPLNQKSSKSTPGDEVFVSGLDLLVEKDNDTKVVSDKLNHNHQQSACNDNTPDPKTNTVLNESKNGEAQELSTAQHTTFKNEQHEIPGKVQTKVDYGMITINDCTERKEVSEHKQCTELHETSTTQACQQTYESPIEVEADGKCVDQQSKHLEVLKETQPLEENKLLQNKQPTEHNNKCQIVASSVEEENSIEDQVTLTGNLLNEELSVDTILEPIETESSVRQEENENEIKLNVERKESVFNNHVQIDNFDIIGEVEVQKRHRDGKRKKDLHKKSSESKRAAPTFHSLAMRVEQSVKEWVTEKTLCLLQGETDAKKQLLEVITQHDRYTQLCKKLNRIQLEDEREDRTDLAKDSLKPLPHFSVLEEEGKKMQLKVSSFYKGSMVMELPQDDKNETLKGEDNTVLPLTDAHDAKALRRRIFLDRLNKILPDLMRTLGDNIKSYPATHCTYDNDRSMIVKALISTFSLSATNIVFKTAEWTLVGLIIMKMLSIIDYRLKSLLATKQASMYISMILMSYKLDENYLDRLIIELTNNPNVFGTDFNV